MSDIRLTRMANCAGCGAKLGAGTLARLLTDLPTIRDDNLIVGFDTSDDACVYKLDEKTALVQTLDFFPPIVDDPYLFGQIAACNALSDIYAMGGKPRLALNIMTVTKAMDEDAIKNILRGGYDKACEAGAIICGGHTINDESPKYGLSVTGFVELENLKTNSASKEGDVLILTKPLGAGILTTAAKAGMASEADTAEVIRYMTVLNRQSCENMLNYEVHSCTDVTGFGLMGHAFEMAHGSNVTIHIETAGIKYHPAAYEMASMGFIPDGAYKNRDYVGEHFTADETVPRAMLDILFDPQTSGGLLISVAEKDADKLLNDLHAHTNAAVIGYAAAQSDHDLIIT
ncbi:MAG: selenide, water dikinase SelD [Lachnospiraceae bacterium]|nr:selenide, water dikinase SelD [Lachnospiraceae bacterium]